MNNIIEQNKAKVSKYRGIYEKNEAAVRSQLIEPILDNLGWTTSDPDFIVHNSPTDERDIPDYTLKINDKEVAYIEAKKLSNKLNEHIGQLARYCTNQGKEYGILTDGMKWILFKAFELDTKLKDRIIWEVNLEKDNTADIKAKLKTISFENFPSLKESTDRLDKLEKAWDNIVNNPINLKDSIIKVISQNIESDFPINTIEDFVLRKLNSHSKLFQSTGNLLTESSHIESRQVPKIKNADLKNKQQVKPGDFENEKGGIFCFKSNHSIKIDVSKSGREVGEQLIKNGLYNKNINSFRDLLRRRCGLL